MERKFKCPHVGCGKGFKDKKTLNQHVKLHTGEKPYKCHLCDYAGTQKTSLNVHLASKHGIKKERSALWNAQPNYDSEIARKKARISEVTSFQKK